MPQMTMTSLAHERNTQRVTGVDAKKIYHHRSMIGEGCRKCEYVSPRVCRAMSTEPETQQLTVDDLVNYLAEGCKPRNAWRWVAILV